MIDFVMQIVYIFWGIYFLLVGYRIIPNTKKMNDEQLEQYNKVIPKLEKFFKIVGYTFIILATYDIISIILKIFFELIFYYISSIL